MRGTSDHAATGHATRVQARQWLPRTLLSAVALAAAASAALLSTNATFTDQVTMAEVSVTGGTLDLRAGGGNGPNETWTGALAAAVTDMAPGEVRSGTISVSNSGTLPFTLTASMTGTDASGCFGYWFRETAATAGATRTAVFPANVTGLGTGSSSDDAVAQLATPVTNQPLLDVSSGGDPVWETDDVKTYTLSVRMQGSCATNGATGTFAVAFNAIQ